MLWPIARVLQTVSPLYKIFRERSYQRKRRWLTKMFAKNVLEELLLVRNQDTLDLFNNDFNMRSFLLLLNTGVVLSNSPK